MKRMLLALVMLFAILPQYARGQEWDGADIAALKQWIRAAPDDALPIVTAEGLEQALTKGDHSAIDREANMLALRLARMHLLGCASRSERSGWNIDDTDHERELEPILAQALQADA